MKKIWFIALGVLLVLLIGVGTAGGSRLAATAKPDLIADEVQPPALEQQATGPISLNIKQESPFLNAQFQQEEPLEAVLTITGGDVLSCEECSNNDGCKWGDIEYVPITQETSTMIEGDSVRTGQNGSATIQFGEEVNLELSANTQIRIRKYRMVDENTVQIQIEHLIGEVFFQVNYTNENSLTVDFKIVSPISVVAAADKEDNTAFSGVSDVSFPVFDGLSDEELENEIGNTLAFNNECGVFCLEENCSYCRNFSELGAITHNLTDNTGELEEIYIDKDGVQTVPLLPGEEFNYPFNGFKGRGTYVALCRALSKIADGFPPAAVDVNAIRQDGRPDDVPPVTTPKENCGDGVCNIYDKENKNNCPEDCD